jgi:hypothetical protein
MQCLFTLENRWLAPVGVKGYMDEEERDDLDEDQESSPSAKRRRKDRETELRVRRDAVSCCLRYLRTFACEAT